GGGVAQRHLQRDRALPIGGAAAPGLAPRPDGRVESPSPERAAELRLRAPWAAPAADGAPDRDHAPLLEQLDSPAAAGHLSYSALATYSDCHYRFYVERVVGLEAPAVDEEPGDQPTDSEPAQFDDLPAPEAGPRERALALGNAVHATLEASARRSWTPPGGA